MSLNSPFFPRPQQPPVRRRPLILPDPMDQDLNTLGAEPFQMPPTLQAPPPLEDEGLLPQISPIGDRRPDSVGPTVQAPIQKPGPVDEGSEEPETLPDPDNFKGKYMRTYRPQQGVPLGDLAEQQAQRPPLDNVRTYTNDDLDRVVRENLGSTMRVSESSTTNQDELDVGRRTAREGAEFAAGQAGLDAYIQDPTGAKAREQDYQRRLGIARAGGDSRQRRDEATLEATIIDRKVAAEESRIDALVAAGKMLPQEKEARVRALRNWAADEQYSIRSGAAQRRARQHPEDAMRILPDDDSTEY